MSIRFVTSGLLLAAAFAPLAAHAEWSGSVSLTSDNIERGVSQSDRQPSAGASLTWRHANGAYAGVGAATVSQAQYSGSSGYKLMPEVGWAGDLDGTSDWRAGASLRGQYFPGARGVWFGELPPQAQGRLLQATDSQYGTLELGASVGWRWVTLSATRSLTDYLGLAAVETGPLGTRVLQSKGTTYLGLDFDWPVGDSLSLTAGVGRLNVPNFDALDYIDWRLGVSTSAWGLRWGLQASGSDASARAYGLRARRGASDASAGNASLQASVSWVF